MPSTALAAAGSRSRGPATCMSQGRLGQLNLQLLTPSDSLQVIHENRRSLIPILDVLGQCFCDDRIQISRSGPDVAIERHWIVLENGGNNVPCRLAIEWTPPGDHYK